MFQECLQIIHLFGMKPIETSYQLKFFEVARQHPLPHCHVITIASGSGATTSVEQCWVLFNPK